MTQDGNFFRLPDFHFARVRGESVEIYTTFDDKPDTPRDKSVISMSPRQFREMAAFVEEQIGGKSFKEIPKMRAAKVAENKGGDVPGKLKEPRNIKATEVHAEKKEFKTINKLVAKKPASAAKPVKAKKR